MRSGTPRSATRNLEEYWTLLWRDPAQKAVPITSLPLHAVVRRHGRGVRPHLVGRAGRDRVRREVRTARRPPRGAPARRACRSGGIDSGHAHPDSGSFIIWATGRYLTGDTGYAGLPHARHHNTITVDGLGQGKDGEHDVWRGMTPAGLDAVRITSVQADDGVRIEADAAAAYPAKAGLKRFRRTFRFSPPGTFTITDDIDLAAARPVQWYLQSDTAPRQRATGWLLGGDDVSLRVEPKGPANVRATSGPAILTAPGRPGAITTGSRDQRGYQLLLESMPAPQQRFEVVLTVEGPAR